MHTLEAKGLYRFFHTDVDEIAALRGVSLHVDQGEIVVVMGPSGSGKSTLLWILAALDEPSGGQVSVMGQPLTRRPESVRAAARANLIGVLLQSGNLVQHLTAEDNVRMAMRLGGKVDEQRLDALLGAMAVSERRFARPAELSGGESARVGLAVALANAPELLLADEPTAEVDAETESLIFSVLTERRARGQATLIATHSAALAVLADRTIQLEDGQVRDV